MTARLIVHPGFHKTGTSTVQKTLQANRAVLKGHLNIALRVDMLALCDATRKWSVSRDPIDLAYIRYEAAELLGQWQGDAPLLLSSEDLSGHMPGRRGLEAYDAAPALAQALVSAFTTVRPEAQITLVYSTRDAAPWLRSCYAQHLRVTRIRMTEAEYAQTHARSADLAGIVLQVQRALPDITVSTHRLEDCTALRLGPLDPILDAAGVPATVRAALTPHPPANVGMSQAARDALLALNRSDTTGAAYKAARKAIHQRHG